MAVLFMDGFDVFDAAAKWAVVSGTPTSQTTTRFSTGRALTLAGNPTAAIARAIPPCAQVFVGAAWYSASSGANSTVFVLRSDGGLTTHLQLWWNAANTTLVLASGTGTTLASVALALPTAWGSYIEMSATIATSGGTAEVRINGSTVLTFTGNTRNGGTSTNIDTIALTGTFVSGNANVDDLYVCDGTGAAPFNTFLGDTQVLTLSPTGAGSATQMTPDSGANYARVNEIPYSAANYVHTGTSGNTDTYAMADLPSAANVAQAVQSCTVVKKTTSGPVHVKTALKSGASTYAGVSTLIRTNDTTVTDIWTTDPATSSAWTIAAVNALEAGAVLV